MEKLFVPFVSAGYPTLDITKEILLELNDMGIPYIELGIPYSDPLADGPTIQKASEIALQNGVNLNRIFTMLESIKDSITSNIIMFSYYNPLYVYGFKRFCENCKINGIYGVLIPDLPMEEECEVMELLQEFDLVLIPLVAPTSESRLSAILSNKEKGFVYCVSSLGVTGERQTFHANLEDLVVKVKNVSTLPVVIGFGISTKDQAREIGNLADGVVVGSKIINSITNAYQNVNDLSSKENVRKIAHQVRKEVENICPYVYNKAN